MSARVDADGDALASYALTANSGSLTAAGWVYFRTLRGVNGFIAYVTDSGGALLYGVWNPSDSNAYPINDGFTAGSGGSISAGSWVHIALVRDGGTIRCHVNGVQTGSVATTSTALAAFIFIGGNTSTAWVDADFAYWRIWQKALTASQIVSESLSPVALERTALYADWPMPNGASRAVDISGMGHNVSEEGAITDGLDYAIRTVAYGDGSVSQKISTGIY